MSMLLSMRRLLGRLGLFFNAQGRGIMGEGDVKIVRPRALSTEIRPPCLLMILWDTNIPGLLLFTTGAAVKKGSKIRGGTLAKMPLLSSTKSSCHQ
jgi:hypothetical protein